MIKPIIAYHMGHKLLKSICHSGKVRYREMIESYFQIVEIDEFLKNSSKYSSDVQGVLTYEMDEQIDI